MFTGRAKLIRITNQRPDKWSPAALTNFMEQSPSCESNPFAASQEIPRILWIPKIN
jgi:hypothetical protein